MSSELWPYVYAIISGEHGIVDSRDDHVVGTYERMVIAVTVGVALNSELQRTSGQDPKTTTWSAPIFNTNCPAPEYVHPRGPNFL